MTIKKGHNKDASPTEIEAIRQTVLNYLEAWYQGEPERGMGSLHPELAKRIVLTHPESGKDTLDNMSAARLAERWGSGDGKATPPKDQKKEVTVLDV